MYIINTFIHNEQGQYKIVLNNLVKMENIWIEVTKNKTKYIIGGIYRHPNTSIVEYTLPENMLYTGVLTGKGWGRSDSLF